jgi:hypothetical protein
LNKILKMDFDKFIEKFVYYPSKSWNLFSIINQNWYCENQLFKNNIKNKQKDIFKLISDEFAIKYWFSKEKTFLLLSLLEDLWRKKCIFWNCIFDLKSVLKEIKTLFNK